MTANTCICRSMPTLPAASASSAVVLRVNARGMDARDYLFYLADNGVWLTDHVSPDFLEPIVPSSSLADFATTSRQPKPSRKTMK